jgi:hypothetical protein
MSKSKIFSKPDQVFLKTWLRANKEKWKEKDKEQKEDALDPIMMDDDQINRIMVTTGRTHSGVSYQYKVNTKKRLEAMREGLESDEEEVEDLWVVEKIEEILCMTYERKMRGPRLEVKCNTPIHIIVSVEPINPCATNTPRKTPSFRQPNFGRRKIVGSTSTQQTTIGGAVQEAVVRYLHHPEVLVQHLRW